MPVEVALRNIAFGRDTDVGARSQLEFQGLAVGTVGRQMARAGRAENPPPAALGRLLMHLVTIGYSFGAGREHVQPLVQLRDDGTGHVFLAAAVRRPQVEDVL